MATIRVFLRRVIFFLPLIFAFTIYYNRFGSVTLFGFKSRETLNMAVVFLRYLLRSAPDPTIARAFPQAHQGHLPMLLPLSIPVDRPVCFGRLQPSNPPKKQSRVVRVLYIFTSTAVSPLCYSHLLIIPSP